VISPIPEHAPTIDLPMPHGVVHTTIAERIVDIVDAAGSPDVDGVDGRDPAEPKFECGSSAPAQSATDRRLPAR
jgi:hypothetical protein